MSEESSGAKGRENLWAPWRMQYIDSLADKDDACFLCRYRDDDPANDERNLVLWRLRRCFAVMNRFPYTGGHTMVAPLQHAAQLADLDARTLLEMMELVRDVQQVLERAVHAQGFNIGINIGRCAGAGLPGHIHVHVVPRWAGDTNFMAVLGDVLVIPQSLDQLYRQMRKAAEELRVPRPAPAS